MGTFASLLEVGTGPAWPARHRFNENPAALVRANSDQGGDRQPWAHRDNGVGS